MPIEGGRLGGQVRESFEQRFPAGEAPALTIDNFAGQVTVTAGGAGEIQVIVSKRASGQSRLDRIEVEMQEQEGGLEIRTRDPSRLSNVSVDLEIRAPASTRVDVHTGAGTVVVQGLNNDVRVESGAGSVTVRDVRGDIEVHTGAGNIDVRGARGSAWLDSGAGSITYNGEPQGECRFETGTGSIDLYLPADVDVEVDLSTGVGDVDVAFEVVGQVSRREVRGVIGSGAQGSIEVFRR